MNFPENLSHINFRESYHAGSGIDKVEYHPRILLFA